jgi:hypothetical protein
MNKVINIQGLKKISFVIVIENVRKKCLLSQTKISLSLQFRSIFKFVFRFHLTLSEN